jgi:hypothetical protein
MVDTDCFMTFSVSDWTIAGEHVPDGVGFGHAFEARRQGNRRAVEMPT